MTSTKDIITSVLKTRSKADVNLTIKYGFPVYELSKLKLLVGGKDVIKELEKLTYRGKVAWLRSTHGVFLANAALAKKAGVLGITPHEGRFRVGRLRLE